MVLFGIARKLPSYWPIVLLVSLFATASSARRFFGDDFCAYSAKFFSDGCFGLAPIQEQTVLMTSIEQAKSQDRFYQVIFYSITQVVLANATLTVLVKFVMTVAICIFVFRIGSWFLGMQLGLLSLVLFIASYPFLGYNPLTNLPGWFNLGVLGFLVFLDQFLRIFFDENLVKGHKLVLLYLGFVTSLLAYEMYVGVSTALLLVLAIQIMYQKKRTGFTLSPTRMKHYWVLWSLIVFYLVVYLGFMLMSQGTYDGTDVTLLNPIAIGSTLLLLSLGAIPLSLFSGLHALLGVPRQIEFTGLVSVHSISWMLLLAGVLFASLVMYYLVVLSRNLSNSGITRLRWILLGLLVLSPNLLLSLTQRYRDWSLAFPFYLTTLNSHIFLSIALVAVAAKVMAGSQLSRVMCIALFVPILALSTLSKTSYFSESIQFNKTLEALEPGVEGSPKSDSSGYVKIEKEIGPFFSKRFIEVYTRVLD